MIHRLLVWLYIKLEFMEKPKNKLLTFLYWHLNDYVTCWEFKSWGYTDKYKGAFCSKCGGRFNLYTCVYEKGEPVCPVCCYGE